MPELEVLLCLCYRVTEVYQDHQDHQVRLALASRDQRSDSSSVPMLLLPGPVFDLWFVPAGFCRSARTAGSSGSTRRGHPGAKGQQLNSRTAP